MLTPSSLAADLLLLLMMMDELSLGMAPLLVSQLFELITRINGLGTTVLLVE